VTFRTGEWLWWDEVYKVNYALVCCRPGQYRERLGRVVPKDVVRDMDKAGSFKLEHCQGRMTVCTGTPSGIVIAVWIRPTADVPVLGHELLHAALAVLQNRGVGMVEAAEEAITYYFEWLLRGCLKRIGRL
jgi:hypothetical protein